MFIRSPLHLVYHGGPAGVVVPVAVGEAAAGVDLVTDVTGGQGLGVRGQAPVNHLDGAGHVVDCIGGLPIAPLDIQNQQNPEVVVL